MASSNARRSSSAVKTPSKSLTMLAKLSKVHCLIYYQSFNNEFFNEFGVNGNQSPGLGSSLIDFKSWLKKPYYYVNCSRVPMEQQNAYRSLQIKGTNSSALTVDYMIFAIYQKSFSLDVILGNIEKID